MQIIDLSQLMNATVRKNLDGVPDVIVDESTIRHLVLSTLKVNVAKFKNEYGGNNDVVIACDSRKYWRKAFFPYYKAKRPELLKKSTLDWDLVKKHFNTVKQEIKEHFPYRVLEVFGAEADDIIGTLCHEFGEVMAYGEPIVIVSGDGDFVQLQKYGNVKQYSPIKKAFISHNNPERYLQEHIIRGDIGDGIPNILSSDDVLVTPGKRQSSIMAAKMDDYIDHFTNDDDTHKKNINRNTKLIDLSEVPNKLKANIIEAYNEQGGKKRGNVLRYLAENRMRNLIKELNSF